MTNFQEERLSKFDALTRCQDPYPARCQRTHTHGELAKAHASLASGEKTPQEVAVAGRIMAMRNSGLFLDLKDQTGKLQIFCHKDILRQEALALSPLLDLGDWIAVTGQIRKTQRGELTLDAEKITLLAKCLRPLPDKFHGIKDTETRYRQRYLDLITNPTAQNIFKSRAIILSGVRKYLEKEGFLEVETPMLHPIPGGAVAKPFKTHHNALHKDLFLRIAPELYLKRLVIGGFEKVFELNRCFRNEGLSPRHNPEFTSLEVYQAFADFNDMMMLTETLIEHSVLHLFDNHKVAYNTHMLNFQPPWPRKTMAELVQEKTGVHWMSLKNDEEAQVLARQHSLEIPKHHGWGRILAAFFETSYKYMPS